MTLEGKCVVITGGAGFIGSWIAQALSDENRVTVLDNFSTGKMENITHMKGKIKIISGDIRDSKKVSAALKGADAVFHEAANVQIPLSIEDPSMDASINSLGTLNVLEGCRRNDVKRLVFASSSAIYGEPENLPVREDNRKSPMSPYAVSKLTAEYYVRLYSSLYGLETVPLRYFNVYGPRQNPNSPYSGVISIFTKNIKEGKPVTVFGDGEQTRDFVNIRDVVKANLLAAESRKAIGQAINIGTGKSVSLNEIIRIIEKLSGKKIRIFHREQRKGDVRNSRADISLAKKLLGYSPGVSLDEGLEELL